MLSSSQQFFKEKEITNALTIESKLPKDFVFTFLIDKVFDLELSNADFLILLSNAWREQENNIWGLIIKFAPDDIQKGLDKLILEQDGKTVRKKGDLSDSEDFSEVEENIMADIGEYFIIYDPVYKRLPHLGAYTVEQVFGNYSDLTNELLENISHSQAKASTI